MNNTHLPPVLSLLLWLLITCTPGCGFIDKNKAISSPQEKVVSISCIGVLPTDTGIDYDQTLSYETAKSLDKGRQILDTILQEELAGRDKIRFINKKQLESTLGESRDNNTLHVARVAAKVLSCNAILQTHLNLFQDRIGSTYSVLQPAATAFDYRLIEATTGKILCSGQFEEAQTSLLDNLLTLNKVILRGLKWIPAEELLREGLKERLSQCPALPPINQLLP